MSFSSNSAGGPMSEINVTPLVDVMLVLLIIFMVTAPMVQAGLRVDLPNAEAPALPNAEQKLRVTIGHEDAANPATPIAIWIGPDRTTLERLAEQLRTNAIVQRDHEAYVQADESIPYGIVVRVLAAMRAAGVERLGIVTDPLTSQ
ncbi:MAG: biopolymer transporter ExbD [Deltaproteobacteria bacterium]|nr:biopolymer transporter ExbD [Deltaproteobacteria bacterium]MBP6830885.1 biopolymer transporter ExbD [Deltaproteobacteria bacterium]